MFPDWYNIALLEYGEKEIPGPKDNKRITQYFTAVPKFRGRIKDRTPHCSAFVNWCFARAGIVGTGSALARSFLDWGIPCGPILGAAVIFWRGKKNTQWGHVGLVTRVLDGKVHTLGANQNNQVNISAYSLEKVLGYRFPKPVI